MAKVCITTSPRSCPNATESSARSWPFCPDGDRLLGLQQLEEVAREGAYARTEAAYFLGQIYRIFEKDNRRALPYFEELYKRYPDNALFHRYTARLMIELGRWRSGVALYEEYVQRSLAGQTGYHRHGRLEAHYYLANTLISSGTCPKPPTIYAATDSLATSSERKRDLAFAALANLLLGQVHDLADRREEAVRPLSAGAALARPRGQSPTGAALSTRALSRRRK